MSNKAVFKPDQEMQSGSETIRPRPAKLPSKGKFELCSMLPIAEGEIGAHLPTVKQRCLFGMGSGHCQI